MKLKTLTISIFVAFAISCKTTNEKEQIQLNEMAIEIDSLLKTINPNYLTDYRISLGLLDSLEEFAFQHKLDSSLGKVWYKKSRVFDFRNLNLKALNYYTKAEVLFRKINNENWYNKCISKKGGIYLSIGPIDSAEYYIRKSISLSKKRNDSWAIARDLRKVASLKQRLSEIDSVFHYAYEILRISNEKNYDYYLMDAYSKLAFNYNHRKEYDSAVKYSDKFSELVKKLDDKIYYSKAYHLKGDIERINTGDFEKAKFYYKKAVSAAEKNNMIQHAATSLNRLSEVAIKQNNISEALVYSQKAVKTARSIESTYTLIFNLFNLSDLYTVKGYKAKAKQTIIELSDMMKKQHDFFEGFVNLYKSKMHYFGRFGPSDSLNYYIDLFTDFQMLYDDNMSETVSHWKTKYETEKKQQEINQLQQAATIQNLQIRQKNIFILLAIVGIGIAILSIIFYGRQAKMKALNKEAAIEQKLLRTQMNPHFISNALVSIEKFIYENSVDQAGKYLTRFSKLMRRTLENSRMTTISLHDEVETLQHYLELQKLRYGNKFDYAIEIDKELDLEEVHIPPMFGQPIIENAIEHGLANKEDKGFIKVSFIKKEGSLVLTVEDNGIGRQEAMKFKESNHQSLSTTITTERIALMNMRNAKSTSFDLQDILDNAQNVIGTRAVFRFPV